MARPGGWRRRVASAVFMTFVPELLRLVANLGAQTRLTAMVLRWARSCWAADRFPGVRAARPDGDLETDPPCVHIWPFKTYSDPS